MRPDFFQVVVSAMPTDERPKRSGAMIRGSCGRKMAPRNCSLRRFAGSHYDFALREGRLGSTRLAAAFCGDGGDRAMYYPAEGTPMTERSDETCSP